MEYKRLYINLHYGRRGIISYAEMSERQTYEFSDDSYYFENALENLTNDLEKIFGLLKRKNSHNTYLQIGSYESSPEKITDDNQKFYIESFDGKLKVTMLGENWNITEFSNKEMTVKETKKLILDYFRNGCK